VIKAVFLLVWWGVGYGAHYQVEMETWEACQKAANEIVKEDFNVTGSLQAICINTQGDVRGYK